MSVTLRVVVAGALTLVLLAPAAAPATPADPLAPTGESSLIEPACDSARRHHDVIVRFGRFPHRNEILGRASTPEEVAFLKQPGSSF